MQKHRVFWASVFANLLTLVLLPEIAHAQVVTVSCSPATGGTYPSITAALNAVGQIGPRTFTVTGTCNENVSLTNAQSLTFIAGPAGAKIVQPQDSNTFDIARSQNITLQNLEIAGVPGSTPGFGGAGVNIHEASGVNILQCDIHDNEGGGVLAFNGSMLVLHATNIHNNTPGDGLDVVNSTADVRTTTIQNNGCAGLATCRNLGGVGGGVGVFVTRTSTVSLHQNTVIQNNADIGIVARLLSTVGLDFSPSNTLTTVQGHNITGIFIQEGAHLQVNGTSLVQGNGGGCPHDTPIPCGGIFATENATLEFQGFGTVSGNQGSGIFVEQGTNLHLGGGVTVSNNSGDGVHIQRISIGDFTPIPGASGSNNTITGNGGASVFCDARSLAIGNLSGFSNVKCGQLEGH